MRYVEETYTLGKAERFKESFPTPIYTTSLTSSIFRVYNKVFKASDRHKDLMFKESEKDLKKDAEEFLSDKMKEWEARSLKEFKTSICSFMLVDLPAKQDSDKPEPFFTFVDIDNVIDASINKDLTLDYLIVQVADVYIQTDDKYYRVFSKIDEEYSLNEEVEHGFGYTPARQFWTSNLNDNPFIKESTISDDLGKLDKVIEKGVGKEVSELSALYPHIVTISQQNTADDYDNQFEGNTENTSGDEYPRQTKSDKLVDKNNNLNNAGSVWEMSYDTDTNMPEPIRMVSMPVENLEHIDESLKDRELKIYVAATGLMPEHENTQAKNKDQIASQLDNHVSVLHFVRDNIQAAEKWLISTMLDIRYGESFVGATVKYGENYLLKTSGQLEEELKMAKENGYPESYQLEIIKQIAQKKYENDPSQLARQLMLIDLEPFATMSKEQLADWRKEQLVEDEDWVLKIKFNELIRDYEAENGDIVKFGSETDMPREIKIQRIRESLISLINGRAEKKRSETEATGGA